MQKINLEFGIGETTLTTFKYGKKIYEEQVKNIISYDNHDILFIFPDNIVGVSSSFVQGLFDGIIEKIGYIGFEERVAIKCRNDKLARRIIDNVW